MAARKPKRAGEGLGDGGVTIEEDGGVGRGWRGLCEHGEQVRHGSSFNGAAKRELYAKMQIP